MVSDMGKNDLTTGNPFTSLLKFAVPVILGNLFQLFYTLADSVIVGKTLGSDALAAVGSTSIIIYFVFCFINGFTGGLQKPLKYKLCIHTKGTAAYNPQILYPILYDLWIPGLT